MKNVWLAHHGILGQKWGVRRYENPDGTLTEAGKKRYNKNHGTNDTDDKSHKKSNRLTIALDPAAFFYDIFSKNKDTPINEIADC